MAKSLHADVLDGGLLAIKNGATKMLLIKTYATTDNYATVTGNTIAEVTMGTGDYTITASGSSRVLTTSTKSATASSGSGANHHIAFTDGSGKVLWVTDETGEAAIASGDTVNFPAVTLTFNQPT